MVKKHIKDFFKFMNLEGEAFSELFIKREDIDRKYKNENAKILRKKEKLYNYHDITKMEINPKEYKSIDRERLIHDKPYAFEHMCFEDNRELEKIFNNLGYFNKMNMRELNMLQKEYLINIFINISAFAQELHQINNDMQNSLTSFENFSNDFYKGIKVK